jgi:hypothetical protein
MLNLIAITALLAASIIPANASDRRRTDSVERTKHGSSNHSANYDCSTRPVSEWLPAESLSARMKNQGFTFQRVKFEAGC